MKKISLILLPLLLFCGFAHADTPPAKQATPLEIQEALKVLDDAGIRMRKQLEFVTYAYKSSLSGTYTIDKYTISKTDEYHERFAQKLKSGMAVEFSHMQTRFLSEISNGRESSSTHTLYEYFGNGKRYSESITSYNPEHIDKFETEYSGHMFGISSLVSNNWLGFPTPFRELVAQNGKVEGNRIICGETIYNMGHANAYKFDKTVITLSPEGYIDTITCSGTVMDSYALNFNFELQFTSYTKADIQKPETWNLSPAPETPAQIAEPGAQPANDESQASDEKPFAAAGVITAYQHGKPWGYTSIGRGELHAIDYSGPPLTVPSTLLAFKAESEAHNKKYVEVIPLTPANGHGYFVNTIAAPLSVVMKGPYGDVVIDGAKHECFLPTILVHSADGLGWILVKSDDYDKIAEMGNFYCIKQVPKVNSIGLIIQQGPLMP